MSKKIIIIGNGGAGNAALEAILEHSKEHKITVITEESLPIYYRPMLSEYISSPDLPKRFYLHEHSWYVDQHIKIMYNKKVLQLYPEEQIIQLDDQETLKYDQLILTTGSNNFIPPMQGAKLDRVIDLRTKSDADKIKQYASNTKKVVVIGGGLLGLELGWQLKVLNQEIEVSVIEMMDRLLPRQLDSESSIIFEKKVKEAGIRVIKGVQTQEIVGDTVARGVKLSDGSIIEADLVVFSIGIRANIQLAKAAGLNTNRGILVNDFMQTSNPHIYAAGDCAEYNGINYAIWPEAVEQGKIAGLNSIDIQSVYEPVVPFNIFHGMNMRLFSIGDVGGNPEHPYDVDHRGDENNFEKYFYVNGKLVGGILMGNIAKSGKLKKAVAESQSREIFEASL